MEKLSIITATHYRAGLLAERSIPSILKQTDKEFEWVVVNDGPDPKTRELVKNLKAECTIVYQEMEHPREGFGLCHGRNLGLSVASGEIVAYLDDDNALYPEYVKETKEYFGRNPEMKSSMAQQQRRRDVLQSGQVTKQGKPFISPKEGTTITELLQHRELFDSNGFGHYRSEAPEWNPKYKIFIDYEYWLQCLDRWGENSFCINPKVLVEYVQTTEGVIGRSSYGEWAVELNSLLKENRYASLKAEDIEVLKELAEKWQNKDKQNEIIPAFQEVSP
jgi:glycosyltransferase involved in cell wall biosynthesis